MKGLKRLEWSSNPRYDSYKDWVRPTSKTRMRMAKRAGTEVPFSTFISFSSRAIEIEPKIQSNTNNLKSDTALSILEMNSRTKLFLKKCLGTPIKRFFWRGEGHCRFWFERAQFWNIKKTSESLVADCREGAGGKSKGGPTSQNLQQRMRDFCFAFSLIVMFHFCRLDNRSSLYL